MTRCLATSITSLSHRKGRASSQIPSQSSRFGMTRFGHSRGHVSESSFAVSLGGRRSSAKAQTTKPPERVVGLASLGFHLPGQVTAAHTPFRDLYIYFCAQERILDATLVAHNHSSFNCILTDGAFAFYFTAFIQVSSQRSFSLLHWAIAHSFHITRFSRSLVRLTALFRQVCCYSQSVPPTCGALFTI